MWYKLYRHRQIGHSFRQGPILLAIFLLAKYLRATQFSKNTQYSIGNCINIRYIANLCVDTTMW